MADVILQNVVNSIQVKDESGQISPNEYPLGALASNIAVGDESSIISVQQKIDEYDEFIENLSTTNIKHEEGILSEYLEKNITTDNKSTGIIEAEVNDDASFVTPKNVIDYLQAKLGDITDETTKSANSEIKSTAENADNNLVTDNAVFTYVSDSIASTETKIPTAAESFEESENAKYVTVELFNSKYHAMFDGNLTDETNDTTTLVNPNQVVTYVKSKTETGAIEENSTKLVTSGTLYTKFAELNFPNKASSISTSTEDDNSYVTPLAVKNYVSLYAPSQYVNIIEENGETVYDYTVTDLVQDNSSYVSAVQTIDYIHTKYIGTVEDIFENVETGEFDEEGNPITNYVLTGKKVIHTPLQDIIPNDESTLDVNNIYFKGFVTPKQVVDYVALQSHNVDTALREYIGITGTVAETGKLLPEMGEGVTILSRLTALEAAVQINTTATN